MRDKPASGEFGSISDQQEPISTMPLHPEEG